MIRIKTMRKPSRSGRDMGPTQKDIADALGLAQSTVATALNPKTEHRLLSETAEQIKAYAKKVGYRPQRFAQIMRGGRTRIIGAIIRMSVYLSNQDLVTLLANELNRSGYRLVLVDPQWFGGDFEAVKNYLLDQGVEGVIFCNIVQTSEAQAIRELLPASLPKVSLQSSVEGVQSLKANVYAAYYHLTRHFLSLGCTRLCHLGMYHDAGMLDRPGWTILDRAKGFAAAIHEAGGIVVADEFAREMLEVPHLRTSIPRENAGGIVATIIKPKKTEKIRNAYEHGYHQTLRLIEAGDLPEAIICVNDDSALGVLAACSDEGVRVPEDVRISGNDDTGAGQFGSVPITSVRRPLEILSRKAVERILGQIEFPDSRFVEEVSEIPCQLIIRRSSGSAAELSNLEQQGFFAISGQPVRLEYGGTKDRHQHFSSKNVPLPA